jgi:hypothetical protein
MAETYENSVSDFVERIKAGAVMVDRSPLKEAIDYRNVSQSAYRIMNTVCCSNRKRSCIAQRLRRA